MKSFLAYELKAIEDAPLVARAVNITEDTAIAGNVRMWAWCWRSKTDVVTLTQVTGFYGSPAADALVAFGFLEQLEPGKYRVRGAERYLRISRTRSVAGKRGGEASAASGKSVSNLRQKNETTEPIASVVPKQNSSNTEALTPNTEHRTPNIEEKDLSLDLQDPKLPDPVDAILDHYVKAMAAQGITAKATKKRRKLVRARLHEGSTSDELIEAIDGLTWSDWHMGRDPRTAGATYSDLFYALRDAEHVEKFARLAREGPKHQGPDRDPLTGVSRSA